MKSFIVTILSKLKFLDSNSELNMEILMLWIFMFISAFRALFANLTLHITPNITWIIPDSGMATTLPILYSLLSTAHQNYLASKGS